jgi:hypothetical protein
MEWPDDRYETKYVVEFDHASQLVKKAIIKYAVVYL